MVELTGKVAIVTGASRGIGRAIAERLTQDGISVVVNYAKSADKAKEVVSVIETKGGKALAVQADMSKVADVRRLFKQTIDRFGRLDILVNNAAVFWTKPLADVTEEEYDALYALNAKGPFFALQEATRLIKDGGRIVNISTDGTRLTFPGTAAYLGTKAALEQFTKVLAIELGGRGITVNTVSPGFTDTEMIANAEARFREMGAQMSPLGRLGKPEDIADVVAFVVGEQGRWLTGQNIHAGGGVVM